MPRKRKGLSAIDFCLILGSSMLLICVLSFGLAKFMHDFEREKELYTLQNVCIAHHIRMGVERRDIYRANDSCYVSRDLQ